MIIKSFEIRKKKFDKQNFFLVYGENEGLKNEIIETLKEGFDGEKETIDETIEKIIRNDLTFDEAMQELKDNSLVSAFFSESEIEKIVSYELKKEVLNGGVSEH